MVTWFLFFVTVLFFCLIVVWRWRDHVLHCPWISLAFPLVLGFSYYLWTFLLAFAPDSFWSLVIQNGAHQDLFLLLGLIVYGVRAHTWISLVTA